MLVEHVTRVRQRIQFNEDTLETPVILDEETIKYLYAWMKFVETAPERYDKGMEIMTGGLLPKIKDDIVEVVEHNSTVLDVGCGTATLPIKLIKQNGCTVKGLDASWQMLKIAEKNVQKEGIVQEK